MRSIEDLQRQDLWTKDNDFLVLARMLLRTKTTGTLWHEARTIAVTDRAPERAQALLKVAVPVGTLVDPVTGPLADLRIISNGFLASLANVGVFDRLLSSMVRVPLASGSRPSR
jgi:hypothetical protein